MTPLSGYYMASYHYGDEYEKYNIFQHKFTSKPLTKFVIPLLKRGEIVYCQVNFFHEFAHTILSQLQNSIILITGQWAYPAINKDNLSDYVLNHKNVLHWFSQNPIYVHRKYSAFPYGVFPLWNIAYKYEHIRKIWKGAKTDKVFDGAMRQDSNKRRAKFQSSKRYSYNEYINRVAHAEFVLSLEGDRPDCYRHWEAIGLGTVPITNLNRTLYHQLFGSNVLYTDTDTAIHLTNAPKQIPQTQRPDVTIVDMRTWRKKVHTTKLRLT